MNMFWVIFTIITTVISIYFLYLFSNRIAIEIPKKCHLWNNQNLKHDDLIKSLNTIKIFEDDAHLIRKVLKCKICNQLYFYEMVEYIDYKNGKDPIYRTWIPIKNINTAVKLSKLSSLSFLTYSSIRIDFPEDIEKPTEPYFVE